MYLQEHNDSGRRYLTFNFLWIQKAKFKYSRFWIVICIIVINKYAHVKYQTLETKKYIFFQGPIYIHRTYTFWNNKTIKFPKVEML